MSSVARTLNQAAVALDGYKVLDPALPGFKEYYVERPTQERALIREAVSAHENKRPFLWFFTGHTGAGKSTELNRVRNHSHITSTYLPLYVNIEADFDLPNVEHTDLILAMAKACASAAAERKCKVPAELTERIKAWGKEIVTEEETTLETQGTGGIAVDLVFLKLGEEVKSGGAKRKLIRDRMYEDITGFIRLLDDLVKTLEESTGLRPLCILDGMDHADPAPCEKVFRDHYATITKPALSKLFVIPLYLLHDTRFAPDIAAFHSTLPNIKVFNNSTCEDVDETGFGFCKDLISRYAEPSLFDEKALRSLFVLSAGIVRDMIRFSGDACGYAADAKAKRVEFAHAEKVWQGEMARLHRLISEADIKILEKIEAQPHPRGADGLEYLLHRKAVIYYPNGEGWYGVHPALRRYYGFSRKTSPK